MSKKVMAFAAAALAMGAAANQADAQMALPLSVEVRGGAAIPMGDFADDFGSNARGASTGPGYSVDAMFNFTPTVGVYAGYSRNEFGVDRGGLTIGGDAEYIDSGFRGGLMASLAPMGALSPYLHGGAVFRSLDYQLGSFRREFDNALGFEVGGGLEYALGQVISITPGVRYVRYAPGDTDGSSATDDRAISFLNADVGLRFRF